MLRSSILSFIDIIDTLSEGYTQRYCSSSFKYAWILRAIPPKDVLLSLLQLHLHPANINHPSDPQSGQFLPPPDIRPRPSSRCQTQSRGPRNTLPCQQFASECRIRLSRDATSKISNRDGVAANLPAVRTCRFKLFCQDKDPRMRLPESLMDARGRDAGVAVVGSIITEIVIMGCGSWAL